MVHGAKKGQQQAQKPHIAKDDLVSVENYKGLYGLAEGEIYGLADGGKSIKLDGTPLINDNGTPNFADVAWEFRAGTQDQSHIAGFVAVENETRVGVELRHDRPWVKAITNRELSAVRIRLNFHALREQDDSGNIKGYAIGYAVDVQTDGGAFVEVLTDTARGKASSGYKKSHRIDLPKLPSTGKAWTIRVRRLTPNRDSDLISDTMSVDAITEIIDAKLRYPNTALLALTYNAKTFSNVAKVAVRLKGKIIQVPTNYNPETRQYNGLWDGTFKLAYSNNPAWVFYDLCTHKRYGLGERLAGLVDKWRLYQIGQYCDEMVDDGKGGKEPRFTINVYIQKADDAYRVLQNIASTFRGMSFWDGSQIVLDSDTPKDPVYTFSPANVVGEFVYQGTRARDRHTFVRVAWDNPENNYQTEYEPVPDEENIAKYGMKQLDINAFGCTSRGQAQRVGLWALKAEQLETQTVSFKTGLMGFIPQVGQVINIADNVFAGRAVSGRILAVNGKQITLDRTAGKVGDTLTVNTGGEVQTAKIVSVRGDTLTLDKAVGTVDDVWAVISDDLKLMQFRILTIAQNDDATFDITALEYNAQKYTAVDNGAIVTPQPYTVLKATPITAPNSVTLTASTRTVQGQAVTTLNINWEQVQGATAYIVEWRKDDGNWQTLPKVSGQSVDIDGVYAGKYTARVRAVDSYDNESLATSSQLTPIVGKTGKPPRLASLNVQGILFGMNVGWGFSKGSEDTNFTEIQVSPDGRSNITTLGTFAYPTNKHEITGLQGGLTQFYRGRIVDKLGNMSDWTAWVRGTTDNQAEKVLNLISGQINESHLNQSLATPIAKIGTLESAVNAVNGQLPTLNGQIATLNSKATNLQNELNTAKSTLQTAVGNITTERNRINTAIRDIGALQSANTAKTQELANLTQTVSSHTSSIRELVVTTGDLNQKYTQLKTATDTANSEITAIKQTQNGQATSIERLGAKFDSLAIGGRNLLLNTKTLHPLWTRPTSIDNGVATFVGTDRLLASTQQSDNIQALENGKVTISFTAKSNQNGRLHIRLRRFNTNNQLSDIAQYITIDSRDFKRYSLTLDYSKWTNQERVNFEIATYEQVGFVCEVKLPKLEIGTVATDWTPAPEDTQSQLDEKASTATLNEFKQTSANADTALGERITAIDTAYKQADTATNAKLANAEKAISDNNTALSQRITALDAAYKSADNNLTARLAREETARASGDTANSQAIRTLESTVNGIGGRVGTSESKIASLERTTSDTNQALATAQNQLNARFDNLSVGGRNLLKYTQHLSQHWRFASGGQGNSMTISDGVARLTGVGSTWKHLGYDINKATAEAWLKDGTTFTLSIYAKKISGNPRLSVALRKGITGGFKDDLVGKSFDLSSDWQKLVVSGTITPDDLRYLFARFEFWGDGVIELKKPKLEYGTVASDWTPAIDDLQADIGSKATTANLETLRQTLTNADTALSGQITALDTAYKSADRQLTANLASETTARTNADTALTQRIDALQTDYNGNKASVANQIKTLSDKEQALATSQNQLTAKFDNLKIGGRNLLVDSEFAQGKWLFAGHDNQVTHRINNGILTLGGSLAYWKHAKLTGGASGLNDVLQVGETYTLSVWARSTQGQKYVFISIRNWKDGQFSENIAKREQVGETWKRIVVTGVYRQTPHNGQYLDVLLEHGEIGEVEFKQPKLEVGNVATDWTPAIADDTAQTIITTTTDLNTLIKTGKYFIKASTTNSPSQNWLFVDVENSGDDWIVKQTVTQDNAVRNQWVRQRHNGAWSAWEKLATGQDIANTQASINEVKQTIATQHQAMASQLSTLQTTVRGQTASIQQHAQSLNGLSAQWTLKVQSGNIVSGIGLASSNGVSDFAVRADKFYIASPTGQKGDTPFTVLTSPQVINGVRVPAGTYIRSAYIQDGSIDIAKINKASINSLSALSANIGTLTTSDERGTFTYTGSRIELTDPNGEVLLRLGLL